MVSSYDCDDGIFQSQRQCDKGIDEDQYGWLHFLCSMAREDFGAEKSVGSRWKVTTGGRTHTFAIDSFDPSRGSQLLCDTGAT